MLHDVECAIRARPESLLWIPVEQLHDQASGLRRNVSRHFEWPSQYIVVGLVRVGAVVGRYADKHFVQQDTECVPVSLFPEIVTLQDLWCLVRHGQLVIYSIGKLDMGALQAQVIWLERLVNATVVVDLRQLDENFSSVKPRFGFGQMMLRIE